MTLLHAPTFAADMGLEINIRTKIRYQYSYIESAVVKIGEETLEVASFGEYYLNGVSNADLPNEISAFAVTHSHPSKNIHIFEIAVAGPEKIVLTTFKDMVSVKIENADTKRFHGSVGMMGEFETGKMLSRNGTTVLTDPNAFASEWQVRSTEPMLFQAISAPQHPDACVLPDAVKKQGRRRLGEASISKEAAEHACAHWEEETRNQCIHDVMATGDLELADAGAF